MPTPPARPTKPGSRFDQIDVLRGVAILIVVLVHIYVRFNGHGGAQGHGGALDQSIPAWALPLVAGNGGKRMTMFFAISGFLITWISIRRFGSLRNVQPLVFYRMRFARLLPLLLAVMLVLTVLGWLGATGFQIDTRRESLGGVWLGILTFTLNHYEAVHGYLPANWSVMWSLSVEEMFYVWFPLLSIGLLRFRRGWWAMLALLLAFVAIGPFARAVWTPDNPIWQTQGYLSGMDAIAMGCIAAVITLRLQQVSPGVLLALEWTGGIFTALVLTWPRLPGIGPALDGLAHIGLDNTLLELGVCLVMYASVLRGRPGSVWTSPLRWLGRNIYEIYLTHQFLIVWGKMLYTHWQHGPLWVWVPMMLAVIAVVGWLVARYFSEPMNQWLRGGTKTANRTRQPAAVAP